MKDYKKPLPQPTPWSKPFWDGCKRHELLLQKCKDCEHFNFYPKLFCSYCLSPTLEWVKASGRGRIYSYTVVHNYAPTQFTRNTPYVVAVIELQEGVRMMSNIIGCPPEAVNCDMDVEIVFDDVTREVTLPKFKPVFMKGN